MTRRLKTVPVQCIAQPSASMRLRMGSMYPERGRPANPGAGVVAVLDDLVKVEALACLLTEAIERNQTTDGRLDEREVAAYVLRHMMGDGGAKRPALSLVGAPMAPRAQANVEAMAVDMMAAAAFGKLITRAIEATRRPKDGLTKMQNVAVYILRAMKAARTQ